MISTGSFLSGIGENPINATLLQRLPELGLPECHLTAGCLFQTIWNLRSGKPAGWGIKDYDIFYFDSHDLSWEAEDAVIRRAEHFFGDLPARIEVRNQARVHLWYHKKFGAPYPALQSAREGIDRYLIACTCIGIDVATGELYAPNGLHDMWDGLLRINPMNAHPVLFQQKAEMYRARWPWLRILPAHQ